MAVGFSLSRRGIVADRSFFQCLPHRTPSFAVIAFCVIISTLARCSAAEDGSPTLTIKPTRLTVENGTSSTVSCKFDDSSDRRDKYRYLWVDSRNNPLDNASSVYPRITFNETTGELALLDARENDTDDYVCYVLNYANCSYSGDETDLQNCTGETFHYKVYVMPDYTTDGIIIGIINCVLLFIFLACLIRSAVADRRRLQKYGRKL